ncbi:MAG: TonB-dependent siderophore receptor [Sphingomonas bacterium]|nr:TonB-dependent siderophore receptor [Sphingomonas bacterium]
MFRYCIALVVALAAGALTLPAAAQTYGDTLLASVAAKHRGIASIRIDATGKGARRITVTRGKESGVSATAPLSNAVGEPIGSFTITSKRKVAAGPIAAELARRIYVADNLIEPDPFVVGASRSPRAQALVDAMIDRFPDLVTLAMHVALPGKENTIIASNFGRIGKLADGDDADVIARGTIRKEVTNGGRRLAVELPMLDAGGRAIGALSTSFTMATPADEARAYARAIAVRDALAARIPLLAALAK